MPYASLPEALFGGWWMGPHFPTVPGNEKAGFPDRLNAWQSFHALIADCAPDASGKTGEELLAEINRVTIERGGAWKKPAAE